MKIIKQIPNLITTSRIVATIVMINAFLSGNIVLGTNIFIIASLTDWADGLAATLLNAKSKLGKYLDATSDKFLNISAITSAALLTNPLYFVTLVPEIVIMGAKLYNEQKKDTSTTLGYKIKELFKNLFNKEDNVDNVKETGRVKAWTLGVNLGACLLSINIPSLKPIFFATLPISLGMQALTLREYYKNDPDSKVEKFFSKITGKSKDDMTEEEVNKSQTTEEFQKNITNIQEQLYELKAKKYMLLYNLKERGTNIIEESSLEDDIQLSGKTR